MHNNLAFPVTQTSKRPALARVVLMAAVLTALVTAGWAGLVRIGWSLPETPSALLMAHGPLMVCGVLSTLVGFERAVALQRTWTFAAPAFFAAGAMSLVVGAPISLSALLMTAGSVVLVAVYAVIVRTHAATFTLSMALGAALLLLGNGLWLAGFPLFRIAPWWMGFLVLTIAGERLELGRVQRLTPTIVRLFAGAVAILLMGIAGSAFAPDAMRVQGLGLVLMGLWLLRFDIARRTIRTQGLARYAATCLLSGHVWLLIGGVLAVVVGAASSGPLYDAELHAVFVGFVFSMIFGHALIIIPAVFGIAIPLKRAFYAPLVLLHASLMLRMAGDLFGLFDVRRWGGLLNVTALVVFLALMVYAARSAKSNNPS